MIGDAITGEISPTHGAHLPDRLESWRQCGAIEWNAFGPAPLPNPRNFNLGPRTIGKLTSSESPPFVSERPLYAIKSDNPSPADYDVHTFHDKRNAAVDQFSGRRDTGASRSRLDNSARREGVGKSVLPNTR